MSAALINECRDRGVSLRADGNDLVIRGPVDAELKGRLRQYKPDLLRLLKPTTDEHGPIEPCRICGWGSWYLAPGAADWQCRICQPPAKITEGFVLLTLPSK